MKQQMRQSRAFHRAFTLVELPAVSKRAFTLVELLVVIGIIVVLMGILLPVASRAQESARRVKCASNLRQLGQAILAYSSANDGKFPRTIYYHSGNAGQDDAAILNLNNSGAGDPDNGATNPFTPAGSGYQPSAPAPVTGTPTLVGTNNVPASIFLLLRQSLITPEVLLCPSAVSANIASPDHYGHKTSARERANFTELNFLTGPTNLSYSIQCMYPKSTASQQGWTWDSQFPPEGVLAADLNPGISPSGAGGDATAGDLQAMADYSGNRDQNIVDKFNSRHHRTLRGVKEGQNVLYGDFHVEFQNTPECGEYYAPTAGNPPQGAKFRDNIYTVSDIDPNGQMAGTFNGEMPNSSQSLRPGSRADTMLLPMAQP